MQLQSVTSGVSKALIGSRTIRCVSAYCETPGSVHELATRSEGSELEGEVRRKLKVGSSSGSTQDLRSDRKHVGVIE